MTDETVRYLFVYGTLMSGAKSALGREQRLRLARESDSLGPASIAHARLYNLGRYPGTAPSGSVDDVVQGEAVLLSDPAATLAWTDKYEGVSPGNPDTDEYARIVREARLAGGETIDAWVYMLKVAPPGGLIEDGRWIH
jgi:gamma-glutamylcyclotransferase (GGCT)/AIG2-like uncharacterized protein YtfP